MSKLYRWGIIGASSIARKFAEAVPLAGNAALQVVASRDAERAKEFAEQYCDRNRYAHYDNYLQLAKDPVVDAVYIGTPHAFHAEHAILCLEQGKAVLCEKPMALNAGQVQKMLDSSKANGAFLMEAMWTRFLPAVEKTLELVQQGAIGDIRSVMADFCFNAPFNPDGRLYNQDLGGGSLLDVGVYSLFLAQLLLGQPKKIRARAKLSLTGVDESCQAVLQYDKDVFAMISSAINQESAITAEITGIAGRITLPEPWYKTDTLILQKHGEHPEIITPAAFQNGFEYEIREVQGCLERGLTESPKMPHTFSLHLCKIMDEIREQVGVRYPGE